jgi:hypothetical protein
VIKDRLWEAIRLVGVSSKPVREVAFRRPLSRV